MSAKVLLRKLAKNSSGAENILTFIEVLRIFFNLLNVDAKVH